MMPVEESKLPGVGKMFKVSIGDERELQILIHNTGKREIFLREDPKEDSEKLFELPDKPARTVGTILDGSYFQPISSESMETKLDRDSVLEWVDVWEGSEIVGKKIGELDILDEAEISVIAIRRGDKTLTNLHSNMEIKEDDELIVIEPEKGHRTLTEICEG